MAKNEPILILSIFLLILAYFWRVPKKTVSPPFFDFFLQPKHDFCVFLMIEIVKIRIIYMENPGK